MRRRGAPIQHCGNRAFYRRSTDGIRLPLREAFIGADGSAAAEWLLLDLDGRQHRRFEPA